MVNKSFENDYDTAVNTLHYFFPKTQSPGNGPGNEQKPPRTLTRPLPMPSKLTSIERNSAADLPAPSPGRQPLPPISGRLEKL